ncbi:hypothetical protein GYMLUDRAFT_404877 [Collybiopsis luxurians FD-317 M1]|uniref:Uncharacterized protein n=1 Tax=Collybiopsis luxurians FD-317 M1 TaxID=944289 RepID=A0A0D0ALS4_9AGAR|nr:hypothetical protein GYMLUDRAFT_404877 [Collybiopsis luxurians FD-317 M1]
MSLSSPTSLSTSISATSTSTNASSGEGGGIFGGRSATPLIIAFLAIGLLTTAAIGSLGWRRAYLARREPPGRTRALHDNGSGDTLVRIREKPKLWDLRTIAGREGGRVGMTSIRNIYSEKFPVDGHGEEIRRECHGWRDIMPIAVSPLNRRDSSQRSMSVDHVFAPESTAIHIRSLVEKLNNFLEQYCMPIRQDEDEGEDGETGSRDETQMEVGRAARISSSHDLKCYESFQVAVAIAMPQPKKSESEVIKYSVGICRVSRNEMEKRES